MTREELNANIEYLYKNDVYASEEPAWDYAPYSRELFYRTDGGGDFSICVEQLCRYEVIETLKSYDVNEECMLWWGGRGVPFDNIKDLYDDIENWKNKFIEIAEGMPY